MSRVSPAFSHQVQRTLDSPIAYFMEQAIENPNLISLAAGLVDEVSLPAVEIAEVVNDLLGAPDTARAALQYGTTQGYGKLRELILAHCCTLDCSRPADLNLTANDVVVTTGSQQLLYLLSEILCDTGDIVITEAPSYFVFHGVLACRGVQVFAVPMDEDGMDLDALTTLLDNLRHAGDLKRVKLIYSVDYYQNPSGLSLSIERRPRLVELVRRFSTEQRIFIVEDAAYRELRYDGPDLPSIKSFDPTNEFVIYSSTFSKPLAPGLKTGYALMPSELVGPLLNLKGNHDFGSGNLAQHIICRLLETGRYEQHVAKLRANYAPKRDAMLNALDREFADWPEVTWTKPSGGMFVWASFPEEIDTGPKGSLVPECVREGMLFIPGEFAHVTVDGAVPRHEMRLAFGVATPTEIDEGIRRLARAARRIALQPV